MPARDSKKDVVRSRPARHGSSQKSPKVRLKRARSNNARPTSRQLRPVDRPWEEHRDFVAQKNLDACNQLLDECWVYTLKEREMLLRMFGAHPWALFEVCHNDRLSNRDRFAEVLGDPDLLKFYEDEKMEFTKRDIAEFCEAKRLEKKRFSV
jgi:hypothetical protein